MVDKDDAVLTLVAGPVGQALTQAGSSAACSRAAGKPDVGELTKRPDLVNLIQLTPTGRPFSCLQATTQE